MRLNGIQEMSYASLFAALTAAGAYIVIPVPFSPIPIVLQNLFVLLAGLLLGSRWGLAGTCIYLLVGAVGFPVFAGGKGGIAHFVGPTGGFLIGFASCAYVAGVIAERFEGRMMADMVAVLAGSLLVYACGVPWLKVVTGMTWSKALLVGIVPFLPGDALKCAAAVTLARVLRPMIKHQLRTVSF